MPIAEHKSKSATRAALTFEGADITVVIPYGKADGNIVRCVASVLAQIVKPMKIIVVANHNVSAVRAATELQGLSADEVVQIADGAACRNANEARNLGCALVATRWTALLDSDDWWDSGHLQSCLDILRSSGEGIEFMYGSLTVHTAEGQGVLDASHFTESLTPENYLLSYLPAQTSSFFFSTTLVKANPWHPELRRHQDYEWFARIARVSKVALNTRPTVHVEWLTDRTHLAHADCWWVVRRWRHQVQREYFRRHHRNLLKSAIRSRDRFVFILAAHYIIDGFRSNKTYLSSAASGLKKKR